MSHPKRKRLMPDLDELQQKKAHGAKHDLKQVKMHCNGLTGVSLQQLITATRCHGESALSAEELVLSLVALYGFGPLFKLASCLCNLPTSLTAQQKAGYISKCSGIVLDDVDSVLELVEDHCPSLLDCFKTVPDLPVVIAPPVGECLECSERLVSNHITKIKLYGRDGVATADKVTLRCKKCSLIYNPTQFGNKSSVGFQYYNGTICRSEVVEATDGVCVSRSLLELQCSLASVMKCQFLMQLYT